MICVNLRPQLALHSNKKYSKNQLTMDINKIVWLRTSDDEQAYHGKETVQKKLPAALSGVYSTANRRRLILVA